MGRKSYIGLSAFLIFVLTLLCLACLPLQVWSKQIQTVLPKSVKLREMSGHWWAGQALIDAKGVTEPLQFSWSRASWLGLFNWHVSHPLVLGSGQFQPSFRTLSIWTNALSIDVGLLNPIFETKKVLLLGQPIQVKRSFAVYDYKQNQFNAFHMQVDWSGGEVRFQQKDQSILAKVDNWRLEGSLDEPEAASKPLPTMSLKNALGSLLLELKFRSPQLLEMMVMPDFLEAFGLRWTGHKSYPAFVVVQPISKI